MEDPAINSREFTEEELSEIAGILINNKPSQISINRGNIGCVVERSEVNTEGLRRTHKHRITKSDLTRGLRGAYSLALKAGKTVVFEHDGNGRYEVFYL